MSDFVDLQTKIETGSGGSERPVADERAQPQYDVASRLQQKTRSGRRDVRNENNLASDPRS